MAARPGESARLEAGPWKTLVCGPLAGLPVQDAFVSGPIRASRLVRGCSTGRLVWDVVLDCGCMELPVSIAPEDAAFTLVEGLHIAARVWVQIAIG